MLAAAAISPKIMASDLKTSGLKAQQIKLQQAGLQVGKERAARTTANRFLQAMVHQYLKDSTKVDFSFEDERDVPDIESWANVKFAVGVSSL